MGCATIRITPMVVLVTMIVMATTIDPATYRTQARIALRQEVTTMDLPYHHGSRRTSPSNPMDNHNHMVQGTVMLPRRRRRLVSIHISVLRRHYKMEDRCRFLGSHRSVDTGHLHLVHLVLIHRRNNSKIHIVATNHRDTQVMDTIVTGIQPMAISNGEGTSSGSI